MKINDVERMTGLTQKAIRLYEAKGLVDIARDDNGYRNYSCNDIETLKVIKLLREVGVTLTDIKLYLFGVITLDELIDKRKKEIVGQAGKNSEQYLFCENIENAIVGKKTEIDIDFTETEEIKQKSYGALSVGIDLGTTTISAVVMDFESKEQIEVFTIPYNSYIDSKEYSEQKTDVIVDKAERLLCHILKSYQGIVGIGITGQMHGIVYVDGNGNAVSNLINWRDKRADQVLESGRSVCEEIKFITGESIFTGYGIATHYYNLRFGLVPDLAVGFCSIMDLFGMRLCEKKNAVTHTSVAASFGLFDIRSGSFMTDKLDALGIDGAFLPRVTPLTQPIGEWNGIPVTVAIGDNQASFLGSVHEPEASILVNIGTGSQISAVSDFCELSDCLELRPFIQGKYLVCGSALCGGSAYAMLERFFRSYAVSAGMQEVSQYKLMNSLAMGAYNRGEEGLRVDTAFCGKRADPNCRGAIKMIDEQSFTPSALILGVLKGMCEELYEFYEAFPIKKKHVVASGGAVRKNTALQKLISDRFSMPIAVNGVKEEAATGAARFAALAVGRIEYMD